MGKSNKNKKVSVKENPYEGQNRIQDVRNNLVYANNDNIIRNFLPLPLNTSSVLNKTFTGGNRFDKNSFTPAQLKVLYNTAIAANKRTGRTAGGTEYEDYESVTDPSTYQHIQDLKNSRVNPVTGAFYGATEPAYNIASTIGRYSYGYDPNTKEVSVSDIYNFTNEHTKKAGENYMKGRSDPYGMIRRSLYYQDRNQTDQEAEPFRTNFIISPSDTVSYKNRPSTGLRSSDMLQAGFQKYGGSVENNNWLDQYKKGGMIKRADGSYSQRGLWDNIRANAGSGKKPTKEMLKQEKKIRAAEKKEYGGYSTTGYKADSPDRNNPYNIIPSGRITMQNVPHPVLGIDNYGNAQYMVSGGEYQFPGNRVLEVPVMQAGGTIPTVADAGSFKDGVWVPNLATIKQQAKKLGSRTVKTKSGSIIKFDENWNVKGVDDAPTMQAGGVPPFVTPDITEYNYRKALQADSNYLHKNLKSYFNKNAKDFYLRNTVPFDRYAIKGNPFGAKTYPKEVVYIMADKYSHDLTENRDQLLRNIAKNLQSEELSSKFNASNYFRDLENGNRPDFTFPEKGERRVIGHYDIPVKGENGWANAIFSHYFQIEKDFPAATQEVIFDPNAKKTESKRQVFAKPPVKQKEPVAVVPVPVSGMQQYPMMQPGQPYMLPASIPALPYDVRVHQWDPTLMGRPDQVKSFMTQEQLEDWKRANRAHSLQGNRYEVGINEVPSQDGAFTGIEQMKEGGIPQRYKNMGFTHVGQKKAGDGQHKWKVLAKKGDSYKVVQGGYRGMQDFKQHHSQERRDRFWDRMGGRDSAKAKDPFSPLYWHKRFGTWEYGGPVEMQGGGLPPIYVSSLNDPRLQAYKDSLDFYNQAKRKYNPGYPEISREKYMELRRKNDSIPYYLFDDNKYKNDKAKTKAVNLENYVYQLGKDKDAYYRNVGKHFRDTLVTEPLKDGTQKQYRIVQDGKLDKSDYTIFDPRTKTSRHYLDNVMTDIYNPNIKPIDSVFTGEDKLKEIGKLVLSSKSTGRYDPTKAKPEFKNTFSKDFINEKYPIWMSYEYQEPIQPIVYQKDPSSRQP